MSDSKDGKLQPWAVSIFGVLTVIIGALLGYWLSVKEKRAALLDDAQREAYLQVLDQIEEPVELELLEADKKTTESEAVESEKGGDAKKSKQLRARWVRSWKVAVNKLAIYGDSAVVKALAEYDRRENRHPDLCSKNWKLDVELYQKMRRSLMPKNQGVSDEDMADLVMLCTPPK